MKVFKTCSIALLGAAAVHAGETPSAPAAAFETGGVPTPTAETPSVSPSGGDSPDVGRQSTAMLWEMVDPLVSCGTSMGQDWLMNLGIAKALGCVQGGAKRAGGGALRGVKKVAQYPKTAVCLAGLTAVPILIERGQGKALVGKLMETFSTLSDKLRMPSTESGSANNTQAKAPQVAQQQPQRNSTSRQQTVEQNEESSEPEESEEEDGQEGTSEEDDEAVDPSPMVPNAAPVEVSPNAAPRKAVAAPTASKKSTGCFSCCASA